MDDLPRQSLRSRTLHTGIYAETFLSMQMSARLKIAKNRVCDLQKTVMWFIL
jgi:hypothetical protein